LQFDWIYEGQKFRELRSNFNEYRVDDFSSLKTGKFEDFASFQGTSTQINTSLTASNVKLLTVRIHISLVVMAMQSASTEATPTVNLSVEGNIQSKSGWN
jgi:hypothetical protein